MDPTSNNPDPEELDPDDMVEGAHTPASDEHLSLEDEVWTLPIGLCDAPSLLTPEALTRLTEDLADLFHQRKQAESDAAGIKLS